MISKELECAIQDSFDGKLDDERAASLRVELKNSSEALDAYCDQALLETALRHRAAGRKRVPGTIPSSVLLVERIRNRRAVMVSLLATAAVFLICGVVLQIFTSPQKGRAQLESSAKTIIRNSDGTKFRDSQLVQGQIITIVQGVSRLELDSGVVAVIDGPAELSLIGRNNLQLSSGHAWFQVPENARGFQVTCPDLEIIDLGTEFGIDQREDRSPEVQVLKGRVKVRALAGKRQALDLVAGDGAELSPDGSWNKTSSEPGKFRKELPVELPVMKMSFEGIDGDSLAIEGDAVGVSGATARLINPGLAGFVPGVSGNALDLKGDGASIETTWSGISGSAPRTVSLWCRIPVGYRPALAPPLVWWGNPAYGSNGKFKFAVVTDSSQRTVLRASFGDSIFNGPTNLADGDWHHLAIVYRGNLTPKDPDFTLYIDGRIEEKYPPVSSKPVDIETDTRSDNAATLGIGKYELPDSIRNPYLKASIDELRIYAGALDDAAIRNLAAGK